MKQKHFAQKRRQLRHAARSLHRLITDKQESNRVFIQHLVLKIKRLIRELASVLPLRDLKKILGATAVLFGLTFSNSITAQSFAAPIVNPFNINPQTEFSSPAMADLDDDGDIDLLIGGYYGQLNYFENEGNNEYPQFKLPVSFPFGLDSISDIVFPVFADLDDDGDFDILLGNDYGNLFFIENTGNASNPAFARPVIHPFGLDTVFYGFAFPALADLDNDGDLDVMVGEYYGNLRYCENIGTKQAPSFASPVMNPFGIVAPYGLALPAFVDLDDDGDLDLMAGGYNGVFNYFENTGSESSPAFGTSVSNPFGLDSCIYFALPVFADLDDDGDPDLLAGEYYGRLRYFENKTITGIEEVNSGLDIQILPNPAHNFLYIRSNEAVERIRIFDITARNVALIEQSSVEVPLARLKSGIYLLEIELRNGEKAIRKFVKE